MPHAAAGKHLARLKVEVRADAAAAFAGPREAGRDVCLVRRLVGREADVAVDAERGPCRIGPQGHAARLETLSECQAQQLERLLEQTLVVGLVRLEPRSVVVEGEVHEELDGFAREAGKCRCHGNRSPVGSACGRKHLLTGGRDGAPRDAGHERSRPVRATAGDAVMSATRVPRHLSGQSIRQSPIHPSDLMSLTNGRYA